MNTKQCVKCDYWRTGNGGAGSEKAFKFAIIFSLQESAEKETAMNAIQES